MPDSPHVQTVADLPTESLWPQGTRSRQTAGRRDGRGTFHGVAGWSQSDTDKVRRLRNQGTRPPNKETKCRWLILRPQDKGMRSREKGMRPPDKGMRPPDKGTRPPDKATRPPDKGTRPPDKGTRPPDKGMNPPDKGMRSPNKETKRRWLVLRPPDKGTRLRDKGMRSPEKGSRPPEEVWRRVNGRGDGVRVGPVRGVSGSSRVGHPSGLRWERRAASGERSWTGVDGAVVARVLAPRRGEGFCGVGTVSGGVASLNHRRHAGNPPGCTGLVACAPHGVPASAGAVVASSNAHEVPARCSPLAARRSPLPRHSPFAAPPPPASPATRG